MCQPCNLRNCSSGQVNYVASDVETVGDRNRSVKNDDTTITAQSEDNKDFAMPWTLCEVLLNGCYRQLKYICCYAFKCTLTLCDIPQGCLLLWLGHSGKVLASVRLSELKVGIHVRSEPFPSSCRWQWRHRWRPSETVCSWMTMLHGHKHCHGNEACEFCYGKFYSWILPHQFIFVQDYCFSNFLFMNTVTEILLFVNAATAVF